MRRSASPRLRDVEDEMADDLSQQQRVGKLTTPAGETTLTLARFDGGERLSQPFEFHVEALSTQANFDFSSLLGLNSCVSLQTVDDLTRYFNGVLVEATWTGQRGSNYTYRLILRPWFWLLSLTSDCRIFESMNVKDIVKKVFESRGFAANTCYVDKASNGNYPTLEYCVQYRETDMAFVSRLMEEYGIYYYFEHSANGHVLVMADGKSSSSAISGLSGLDYLPQTQEKGADSQAVWEWAPIRRVETGRWVLNDYYYETPSASQLASSDDPGGYEHDKMEMYDFPGRFEKLDEGNALAQVRVQADQALDHRVGGAGAAPSLYPGALVSLQKHPVAAENVEYLVVRCSHIFDAQSYESGGAEGGGGPAGVYEFTTSDRQFRAPLLTPKPQIAGVQSALVVGKEGEEIDVDEMGRVCVVFYWDRKKTGSIRMRVATAWAGGHRRGILFSPRIGDEVLVAYMDGDPDRPVVVGSAYNSANKPPQPLPGEKNRSVIRSDSTKGHTGHHVIGFDDTAGSELLYMRAQKDMTTNVLNNELRNVFANETENVAGNETINVGFPPPNPPDGATPSIGGAFTLNALQTATINVGPQGSPLTQIKMDNQSITLSVGPSNLPMTQIVMNMTGITLSFGPQGQIAQITMGPTGVALNFGPAGAISNIMLGPAGLMTMSLPPTTITSAAGVTFATPMVTIPLVTIGAGTCSGLPII
jgi:type VI secretion system secreted protein VgrG